jgi:polyhydroxybutyrate depolymerase
MERKKLPSPALSAWSMPLAGVLLCWCAGSGCTPDDSGAGTPGSAGSGPGGSASGTAGVTGSGGSAAGGTSATAGTTGAAGATGVGGAGIAGSTGGGGGNTGGSAAGGSAAGGRGGSSAAGSGGGTAGAGGAGTGGAGTKPPPNPSAGCGKATPSTGTSSSPLMVSNHKYYMKLPSGFDNTKPFPVLFMFNPTGNPITWAEQNAGYESNGAKTGAIRVYPDPASEASGWGAGDVSFFMPLYDAITNNFCVDKARVFAAGESSGGDFSGIIGCEYAAVLRAVVPCSTKNVSQYPLDATKRKCTGEVTAIVMQGKNDNVVGPDNGPKMRDFYRAINHCGTTTVPVQGYTDTLSNCVQYQGCDEGFPVYWCNHTDPNYSGTNHGWPTFAANMTWGVFSSY